MSTKVPIKRKGAREEDEEGASVIFVGPASSGKTTALILLHQTLVDYRDDLKCTYTPSIKNDAMDLFTETNRLIMNGSSPSPTVPSQKDTRIEFNLEFRGRFGGIKKVKLLFADMSGEISSTLMKIFPSLINSANPQKVREQLEQTGLNQEDVEYLIHTLLSAKGVILIADASQLGGPKSPDPELSKYLNNLYAYSLRHGEKPKGYALLLTKFDQFKIPGFANPKDNQLRQLARNLLSNTENYAATFTGNNKSRFKVFYSVLVPNADGDGFVVNSNNERQQSRVEYSVQQYVHLIEWLKDTFGE